MIILRRQAFCALLAMFCAQVSLAADQSGTPGNGLGAVGIDVSKAGRTAADHRKFFSALTSDEQARILKRCEAVTTTGSVGNVDQPGGNSADTSGAPASNAQTASAGVMAFCDDVR
jgi:hypothetical protein